MLDTAEYLYTSFIGKFMRERRIGAFYPKTRRIGRVRRAKRPAEFFLFRGRPGKEQSLPFAIQVEKENDRSFRITFQERRFCNECCKHRIPNLFWRPSAGRCPEPGAFADAPHRRLARSRLTAASWPARHLDVDQQLVHGSQWY